MAKKKKNRRLNIARKRAKLQQNQKVKRKQMAIQKQRALQAAESPTKNNYRTKLRTAKLLLDESEFENITFDLDLLQQNDV